MVLDGSEQKKQQIVAATLALLFEFTTKFYLGYNTKALSIFFGCKCNDFGPVVFLVPPFASFLIGLIEGVIYFRKNFSKLY